MTRPHGVPPVQSGAVRCCFDLCAGVFTSVFLLHGVTQGLFKCSVYPVVE